MPREIDPENEASDPLLKEMSGTISSIVDAVENDPEYSLFVMGTKAVINENMEAESIQTYISVTGMYGVIAEGLYAELCDQISNGNLTLFSILRDVVRDVEAEFDIDPEEEIMGDDDHDATLH